MVPRAECAYRQFDLGNLRPRHRSGAARLAASRHEPVPGAPFHVAWTGGIAHVWWWLDGPVDTVHPQAGWIPESLLRGVQVADGARLVAGLRGVEGQGWINGFLACSQWWPRLPDAAQWARFTRGCGLPAGMVPEPLQVPIHPVPWGDRARGVAALPPAQAERFAWQGLAIFFAVLLGWQATGLVHWSFVGARTEARLEALRATSLPLLDARDRAEAARVEIDRLRTLQVGVDDQALMVEVARRLPDGDALAGWDREGPLLRFAVRTSDIDPRTYVAALERMPGVANLQATPEAGAMLVEMELPGHAQPSTNDSGTQQRNDL